MPNFLGIGAPKTGTTWLADCLREHPDIFMASMKEVNFLVYPDIEGRIPEYCRHFEGARDERRVGEFTTKYLASRYPAPRIRAMMPDALLLVCLRAPADQIYSHYWHLARQNFHETEENLNISFEEALERYPQFLLEPARYWTHLQHWLGHFPEDRFHFILFDDIVAAPEKVIRGAFHFLDVDTAFRPSSITKHGTAARQGTSPRSAAALRTHASVYRGLNRFVYQPIKKAIGISRADRLKEFLKVRSVMQGLFFRTGYPTMKERTREKLESMFEEEVRGVEGLLGRKLPNWRTN